METIYLAAGGGGAVPSIPVPELEKLAEKATDVASLLQSVTDYVANDAGQGSWILLSIYLVLAIGISFFCSVWEASLLSVTRPYIAKLKKDKPKAGKKLEYLKDHIDRPLISILTLNTIAHTVGAMKVGSELTKLTGGGIWEQVGNTVMTLLVLIASEIIPKNLGARNWKKWAPWVGNSLSTLTLVMTPIVKVISAFSKGGHGDDTFSREELAVMAEMGRKEGMLEEDESRILGNLLTLKDATVEDVMTPRVVIFALKESTTIQEFIDEHGETPFSRVPLYAENRDDITGFVLKDDILLAAARGQSEFTLGDRKRDVAMISELTNLPDAFESFHAEGYHMAIVNDEFGGVAGIVTMEDIMETLLGLEIVDEVDTKEDMQAFARARWEKRSKQKGINILKEEEKK